jgi:hypothetical protein
VTVSQTELMSVKAEGDALQVRRSYGAGMP